MNMRTFINLFESLSYDSALEVFKKYGIDALGLNAEQLRRQYLGLVMKHHPDRGGDVESAKEINAAYDALKNGPDRDAAHRQEQASKYRQSRYQGAARFSMDRPHFENLDYVKFYFNELTKNSHAQDWTVMNFDGRFFRNSFTIKGNYDLFPEMAKVMNLWDNNYDCAAVLVGTQDMMRRGIVLLIWTKAGGEVEPFVSLNYESMNLNPANDRDFCEKLPTIIRMVADGSFISQNMLD